MFKNGKKMLKYAVRLCLMLAIGLMLYEFLLDGDSGQSIIPILGLCVVANGISYVLYKQKQ